MCYLKRLKCSSPSIHPHLEILIGRYDYELIATAVYSHFEIHYYAYYNTLRSRFLRES